MPREVNASDLLIRPTRENGEGKLGYFLRIADANGLSFSTAASLDFSCVLNSKPTTDDSAAGSPALKPNLTPSIRDDVHNRGSIEWISRRSRFCPLCLSQRGIWKIEWESLFYDACCEHNCWLVDSCSKCTNEVTWKRGELLVCDCSSRFSDEIPAPCPESVARLSATMVARLTGTTSISELNVLKHCKISQIQRVVRLLGAYGGHQVDARSIRPQRISDIGTLSVSWQITSLAAEVLANWPDPFFLLLKKLDCRGTGGQYPDRLSGRFGNLYAAVYEVFKEPCFAFLREAFEQYLLLHWKGPIAKRNTRLREELRTGGDWIAANPACKELGVSSTRLRQMIGDGIISGTTMQYPGSGRIRTIVNRTEIPQIRKIINAHLNLEQAASQLGLGKKRMANIRALLFPNSRKVISALNSPWMIRKSDVDRILDVSQLLPTHPDLEKDEVSLGHVIRYWMWDDQTIADLILHVIAGSVLPNAKLFECRGIKAWIFLKESLSKWYEGRNSFSINTLSVPELAVCLGVKQEVAYFLVRNEFIRSSIESVAGRDTRKIYRDAINEFNSSYILLARVARHLKRSTRGLLSKLQKMEIYPISGPSVDGGRQIVMLRTSQLELELKAFSTSSNAVE